MKANGSVVLGIIALIMVCFSCIVLVLYRVGGGRNSTSKTVRYAGGLGKLLFAASVVLIAIGLILVPSGEGYTENLSDAVSPFPSDRPYPSLSTPTDSDCHTDSGYCPNIP